MNMQIGIVAGSKSLPLLLAKRILKSRKFTKIVAICFKGETSFKLCQYVDKRLWVKVGKLKDLREAIKAQKIKDWVMAGQVNPLNIFKKSKWDNELKSVAEGEINFCPHTFFKAIINHLESDGINFLDSTLYLKDDLAQEGVMNGLNLSGETKENIDFGLDKISKFVEIDIGQVLVVKNKTVVSLEALEGTDNTIKRGFKIAGPQTVIFKFARQDQDLRFDVPVVGISTLKLAKRIQASCLVLEQGKTIILEKEKFLYLSKKWNIPVIGLKRS
jgi:hypothetical protein